jgi:branched-chain amino acid transport system ATP-binding protein
MSVLDNLQLGAFSKKARSGSESTLERVFALFPRLDERKGQMAGSLSGGEQQMCAIGRALMNRPKLLMLDEPSLGLAPILVSQMFQKIQQLHRDDGLTILLVEQNLHKALSIADRGYVVETGAIQQHGTSKELLAEDSIRSAYLGM